MNKSHSSAWFSMLMAILLKTVEKNKKSIPLERNNQ
jgi:hypothetical protein